MSQFDDARTLVDHCEAKNEAIRAMYARCLAAETVAPELQVEVKNFMENLRSALDYCASALFSKYGSSTKSHPKIYFPCVFPPKDRVAFRNTVVEQKIPGLLASRPDIVDILESYQYFGHTGNWLCSFMRIVNEHKHEHLTGQVKKQYKTVAIKATIPDGETLKIDPSNIPLGGGPDKPFHAAAGTWTGLVFADSHVQVMPFIQNVLQNVRRIVEKLAAA